MDDTQEIETQDEGVETQEAPAAEGVDSVKSRALRMGWKDQPEYRGPPEKWVDAETFMKVTDNHLGMKEKETKRILAEVERLNATVRKLTTGQAARIEREVARLMAEQERAVEAGDVKGYRAVSKEITDYNKELQEVTASNDAPSSDFAAWAADNQWYAEDESRRALADGIADKVMARMGWDGKSPPTRAMYDAVTDRVRSEFPHKFAQAENPRRKAGSPTEGRPAIAPSRNRAKGWDDIPADDRAMVKQERLIGRGGIYATEAEYAKAYWQEYGG